MLEREVKNIDAIEVPSDKCIICFSEKPCNLKITSNNGTCVVPPPTPKSPAANPTKQPIDK